MATGKYRRRAAVSSDFSVMTSDISGAANCESCSEIQNGAEQWKE
jgi:hypothetical protein